MSSYSEIARCLSNFENRLLGDGASKDEIAAAEHVLGVRIVGGYRKFLEQFGWGGVEDLELHGLGSGVPFHLDLVRITQSERNEMEPRLQHQLVPVMNDGGGNLYCIDTTELNEPTIVLWDHTLGAEQVPEIAAESFASWMDEQLRNIE